LPVKANQPSLYEGIEFLFADPVSAPTTIEQYDRHGDRTELRELSVSADLNAWAQWPHLAQVARVVRTRTRKGETTSETAYFITSLPATAASPHRLLALVRGHWSIENRVHWVRDVTFDEDRSQVRSGAAPQAMAACRNAAMGLLRCQGVRNIAAAVRSYAYHPTRALALVTSA